MKTDSTIIPGLILLTLITIYLTTQITRSILNVSPLLLP